MWTAAPPDVPADVEIDPARVSELIDAQHPDLSGPVEPFSEGWDNVVFRIGDRWLARMPRRALGAANLVREQAWMEHLPALPVQVPTPVRRGVPGCGYPYPWSIVPHFHGEVVGVDPVPAEDLLGFLQALHQPCPREVPTQAARSMPLSERSPLVDRCLEHEAPAVAQRIRSLWEAAVNAAPHSGPPMWVHGDLHPLNLLASAGRLTAVLDWGDLFGGDPAPDLAAIWMLFPPAEQGLFTAVYDDAVRMRGMGWAVYYGLVLSDAARRGASAQFGAIGSKTIAHLVSDRHL